MEWSRQFLQQHEELLACPICRQSIRVDEYSLLCEEGHRFNVSKKGSVHLMKQQANEDYDRQLFIHRHHVMSSSLFQPVLDEIARHIVQLPNKLIVDIGCGEGSHLAYLQKVLSLPSAVGVDIAKEGIHQACVHYGHTAFWCLADLTNLPFADQSCATLLNILTPSHYEEFERILAPRGVLIKVIPGAYYLKELRERLYRSQPDKLHYSNEAIKEKCLRHYPSATIQRIHYTAAISKDMYDSLLEMTPLYWGASEQDKEYAHTHPAEAMTIDMELIVCHYKN